MRTVRAASDPGGAQHKSNREAIGRPLVPHRANHPDGLAGRRLRRAILPLVRCSCFLPVLLRGFAWFAARPEALTIHALGKSELVYACAFGVLLVLGMRLP